jgi:uncharacterized membrane protein
MSQNPFETPLADPQYAHAGPMTAGQIDIGRTLSEAWSATWANFPLWLGVGIVGFVIYIASAMTIIGIFIVLPVLMYGYIRFMLNMLEPNKAEFSDLFAGFSRFGSALLPMLGLVLLMFVPVIPAMIGSLTGSQILAGLGSIFQLACYVVVGPRIFFAAFYIVDRDMGLGEALQVSWDATRGQWLAIIGMTLLSYVVMMAGLLALIVGVFVSAQIAYLMYASAYRQLSGR